MKKFILSLFALFVGIISFCNAQNIILEEVYSDSLELGSNYRHTYYNINENHDYDLVCYRNISSDCSLSDVWWNFYSNGDPGDFGNTVNNGLAGGGLGVCTTDGQSWISSNSSKNCVLEIKGYVFSGFNSEFCQSEFNLIPVEDVDTNYCVGNGLCPNECGSGTDFSGDLQYSNIYINSILHPGKQNIFIDIPDYITRDYSSAGDDFNVYVGSGYDVDYINSIIDINSYRPDSEDFTNVFVSGLTLIFPYIFILLLIVFIWKFIKRVFK